MIDSDLAEGKFDILKRRNPYAYAPPSAPPKLSRRPLMTREAAAIQEFNRHLNAALGGSDKSRTHHYNAALLILSKLDPRKPSTHEMLRAFQEQRPEHKFIDGDKNDVHDEHELRLSSMGDLVYEKSRWDGDTLHDEDRPALQRLTIYSPDSDSKSGRSHYERMHYVNGVLHREDDKPAVSTETYYPNGQLEEGSDSYYINGKSDRSNGPALRIKNYNDQGRLLRLKETHYTNDYLHNTDDPSREVIYHSNGKPARVKEYRFNRGMPVSESTYNYTADGLLHGVPSSGMYRYHLGSEPPSPSSFDLKGAIPSEKHIFYDSNGRANREVFHHHMLGELVATEERHLRDHALHNENGPAHTITAYNKIGHPTTILAHSYENGNRVDAAEAARRTVRQLHPGMTEWRTPLLIDLIEATIPPGAMASHIQTRSVGYDTVKAERDANRHIKDLNNARVAANSAQDDGNYEDLRRHEVKVHKHLQAALRSISKLDLSSPHTVDIIRNLPQDAVTHSLRDLGRSPRYTVRHRGNRIIHNPEENSLSVISGRLRRRLSHDDNGYTLETLHLNESGKPHSEIGPALTNRQYLNDGTLRSETIHHYADGKFHNPSGAAVIYRSFDPEGNVSEESKQYYINGEKRPDLETHLAVQQVMSRIHPPGRDWEAKRASAARVVSALHPSLREGYWPRTLSVIDHIQL